jgi:hypothetical protein
MHPYLKHKFAVLFQTWIAARALTRDFLQPYLSRVGDPAHERALLRHNNWLLLGYGLPLYALLSIPFFGPLFYCMGQAAAAPLVIRLLESGKWDPLRLLDHRQAHKQQASASTF